MLGSIILSIGLLLATDGSVSVADEQKIMGAINQANIIFDESAHKTGGHRDLIVDHEVTTVAATTTNYLELAVNLIDSGLIITDRIYIVFAPRLEVCGTTVHNLAILGDMRCWGGREVAHELVHVMGGVSGESPHGDGIGHCTDEYDVMCYDDGFVKGQITYPCLPEEELLLDCGEDDYYNTDPPPDSWLGLHPEHNRAMDSRLRREHDHVWLPVVGK